MKSLLKTSGELVAILLVALCSRATAQSSADDAPHRSDQILIRFKAGVNAEQLRQRPVKMGKVRKQFPGLGNLQVVSVPDGETAASYIATVRSSGLVELAEPDFVRQLDLAPNDPQYTNGTAWWLNNLGQSGGTIDADIDAPEAWEIRSAASNVIVAVIDTGIRRTHEDLAANVWTNAAGYGWNALATNAIPADDEGHGSLVSGVLGGVGNNGKGSAGVAWRVQIMACKSFDAGRNGTDSDIIEGLEFARTNGASIINMSLSGTGFSVSLSNALAAVRAAGIIVVASAGNEATNIDASPRYPACYDLDNIISVAATTRTDDLWSSSNFGATNVDLAAPGHQITSTFTFTDTLYIGPVSGTSFAAPFVAGTCALLRARYPTETPVQIIARVLNGVDVLPSLTGKCATAGRLNLRKALSLPIRLAYQGTLNFFGQPTTQWRVTAGPTRNFVVEASTNLITWSAVYGGTTSAGGTADFFDPLSGNYAQRFYRVVAEP